ncbi:hypothetical protein BDV36DRAFT_190573 [Aspergillus pseudocaelatus]|uniref:Uncharacterized protein n=1 Tax=Aspergillus pseudocaelatus TaxID=1825620 RepID=A0ABQ6WIW1_9EURO|nr:hypothetical protein BDV36DRAFT_190573 [Aspergillus pseudocaelatus]
MGATLPQPRICESSRVYPCVAYSFCRKSHCKQKKKKKKGGERKKIILILISLLGLIANESRKALGELSGLDDQKVSCRRAGLFPDNHLRSFNPALSLLLLEVLNFY